MPKVDLSMLPEYYQQKIQEMTPEEWAYQQNVLGIKVYEEDIEDIFPGWLEDKKAIREFLKEKYGDDFC